MEIRTRFAPSPTGYMHLGNLWIAFLNWMWTRQHRGRIILRIEDIDRQRCRDIFTRGILHDLEWMGLDYDEGPENQYSYGSTVQSHRLPVYDRILQSWASSGNIYPCYCSRARIHQISSAPHEGEERPVYDGHCRYLTTEERMRFHKKPSWRLKTEKHDISFEDLFFGEQSRAIHPGMDDFVVKRADEMISYQLAVSVDDGAMGVTHVLRGNDLMDSTFFQVYLLKMLGYPIPAYGHLPLLTDPSGTRLSKRQHGITIRELRDDGLTPEDLIGCMLYWAGAIPAIRPVTLSQALLIPFEELRNLKNKHIIIVRPEK